MLKIEEICTGYDGQEVLHGISAGIEAGRITVLAGPNGCGKTTFLKSMIGLVSKTSGEIWIDGKKIEEYSAQMLAKKIAYLPQKRNVPDITVRKMVLHGRFPYLDYPRRYWAEDLKIADQALQQVGMEAYAEQNLKQLSGGMQQKVFIAMALAQDTPVILMDEPTSFLDIAHQIRLMETVRKLAEQGKAVVLVLHDLAMALRMADQILVLREGRMCAQGTPEAVYKSGVLGEVFGVKVKRVSTEDGWQYYYG